MQKSIFIDSAYDTVLLGKLTNMYNVPLEFIAYGFMKRVHRKNGNKGKKFGSENLNNS